MVMVIMDTVTTLNMLTSRVKNILMNMDIARRNIMNSLSKRKSMKNMRRRKSTSSQKKRRNMNSMIRRKRKKSSPNNNQNNRLRKKRSTKMLKMMKRNQRKPYVNMMDYLHQHSILMTGRENS
jgi:ATPase subunit of ABC transporter with duplicated ATPase domains